jgi:hypothetical protein
VLVTNFECTHFDHVNSRRCSSLAALIDPADAGYGQADAYAKKQIADCEAYTEFEINMAHLDVSDMVITNSASPAGKANGFGDKGHSQINLAVRQRGCSDCRWEDRSCELNLQQYKNKWWILMSNCLPETDKGTGEWHGVPYGQ